METEESSQTTEKKKKYRKRYYRKRVELFSLLEKIKLWPSRRGILHGIKSVEKLGDQAVITTHCEKKFVVKILRTVGRPGGSGISGLRRHVKIVEFQCGSWTSTRQRISNVIMAHFF